MAISRLIASIKNVFLADCVIHLCLFQLRKMSSAAYYEQNFQLAEILLCELKLTEQFTAIRHLLGCL